MGMDKLWQSKHRLEEINAAEKAVNTAPIRYRRSSGLRFEERYRRITTYLENELFRELESLREQGLILNLTAFFNDATQAYLDTKFKHPNQSSDSKPQRRTIKLPAKNPVLESDE